MNTLKRIFVGIIIIIIVLCAVFYSYSAIENGAVVYATNQDGTLTNDELDVAISSLLQSHGGNIFSPQNYRARKTYEAGLIHNFIYGDGGGYDSVRQHINGGVGGNNELRFDFDGFIIQKFNTWLNLKLQNGEFGEDVELNENGMFNEDIDNLLYSGEYFVDADGHGCLVYYSTNYSSSRNTDFNALFTKKGTKYKYTNSEIGTLYESGITTITNNYNSRFSESYNITRDNTTEPYKYMISGTNIYGKTASNEIYDGELIIMKYNDKYYFGWWSATRNYSTKEFVRYDRTVKSELVYSTDNNITDTDINFYTNNNNNVLVFPTINEGDNLYITPKVNVGVDGEVNYQPYIINEGDTINNVINQYYIDSNTPDKTISYPSDDPGGGGGGSSDNPSGGTPPDWSNNYPHLTPDGEGGFNFNFTLPDLNIDWNISGLSEKFPFSIPFDLMAFCQILDAEPETPRFEGNLVLPMLTYHIDLNLERFNTIAQLLRNLEFVGFCIGLLLITRSMIKG